jgi:NAD(P)-dependent dehydrogenase (short-subunit alcohol dehydrogenase family)
MTYANRESITPSPVALITGAASGIGAAVAHMLTRDGWRIIVADLDVEAGAAVAADIGGRFVRTDVTNPQDNQAAVAAAIEVYGRLDAAVLNAGIPGRCSWDDFTVEAYRETMATNVDGAVYGIKACLPPMRARGAGAIIVNSSLAGLTADPNTFYSAAKHALIGLVRSTAMLVGGNGVTVNALCLGLVDTPLLAPFRAPLIEGGLRLATPEEAAQGVQDILTSGRTGEAWIVQAGQPAYPATFPNIPLARR